VIISLIAFYAVLSGTENKRILQVKNEIYTFEMTEEELKAFRTSFDPDEMGFDGTEGIDEEDESDGSN